MRGDEPSDQPLFSYVSAAQRIPQNHPLRAIRGMADAALRALSGEFDKLYSKVGRPSIPPEHLLRALLLQYFYGIRSERLLMEQLEYNLLFRWFVGLSMDDDVWNATVFSKNRERLLGGEIAQRFLEQVVSQAQRGGLTSDEHFSVDGTLIEAWASQKSFRPKDGSGGGSGSGRNPEVDFRGQARRNDTGSGSEAVPQGPLSGGEAGVSGPRGDREPQRTGDGLRGERGERVRGAASRCAIARANCAPSTCDGRCGQGL
jgi:transposase